MQAYKTGSEDTSDDYQSTPECCSHGLKVEYEYFTVEEPGKGNNSASKKFMTREKPSSAPVIVVD